MKLMKKFPARSGLVLLLIFFIISVWLIFKYVDTERQRDLANWQSRLGMLADLHRSDIENELRTRREMLRELAENPSLKLYLSQSGSSEQNDDIILAAQLSHVRNLLAVTGERFGFNLHQESPVNLATTTEYGIAVTDQNGKLLVASKNFPPDTVKIEQQIRQTLQSGTTTFIDIFSTDSGQPAYGYIMPVFQVQETKSQPAIGAVIALLDPRHGLFEQLDNKHLDTGSDETLLLKISEHNLMFISPLLNDFPLFHQIATTTPLAESLCWQESGSFTKGFDYRGKNVLAVGRNIGGTPWFIVQKIDAAEALAESDQHQSFLLTSFLLLTGFISVTFIAIWRHSTSVRLQNLSASLEAQTTLLNAVSDNIHDIIFLLDENNDFVFANLSLAKTLGIDPAMATGRNLANVLGLDAAHKLENLHLDPGNHEDSPNIITLPIADTNCTYHVSSLVLPQGKYRNATLYVLHDISELKTAQEKRDRLARGIIGTLVKAVDLHDPYCVDHSSRTREVAMCIAAELNLDQSRRDALEMAALLANIGKLFLPREILTKMEALTDAENEMLKWHIDYAVDILKQLEFEGPVVEIISQKNEYLDGSGYPRGLQANAILTESRILAVANAFVAMASARAYREGRPIKDVLNILLTQCDQHYDRHVVAALFHIAENKTDWGNWKIASPVTERR